MSISSVSVENLFWVYEWPAMNAVVAP